MKAKEIYMYVLGGFVIAAVIACTILLILIPLPETNKDVVNIIIGALVTSAITVIGYFFGTSKSSADKTEIMAKGKNDWTSA